MARLPLQQGDHPTPGRGQAIAPTMLRIGLTGPSIVGATLVVALRWGQDVEAITYLSDSPTQSLVVALSGGIMVPGFWRYLSSFLLPFFFSYYLHLRMLLGVRAAFMGNCWMAQNATRRWRVRVLPCRWRRVILRVTLRVWLPMLMECSLLAVWIPTRPSTTHFICYTRERNITQT
jgi:hypothetical protein